MAALSVHPGEVYSRLTVLCRLKNDCRNRPVFLCRCRCGHEIAVRSNALRTGNTRSCGCLHTETIKETVVRCWRKQKGEAAFNAVLSSYQAGAAKRKLIFQLNREQFARLITAPCVYCGQQRTNNAHPPGTFGAFHYTGLDRVDNGAGYVLSNVVPCCKCCNRMKSKRSRTEFLAWVKKVYDKHYGHSQEKG